MRLEVLISCMHQTDTSIIERTGIQSDVLVINQCDKEGTESFDFYNRNGEMCHARFIHTTERGLSRSRNMAIANARGDIWLICDDDEIMEADYVEKITNAFKQHSDCQILAFALHHPKRKYPTVEQPVGYFRAAKLGSIQLAFRKCQLVTSVKFCEKMGSGTGNGGGEENKFVVDCLRRGAHARFIPAIIASVAQTVSQWQTGFGQKYWTDRGWVARMIYGPMLGFAYMWYVILLRSWRIGKEYSFGDKMKWMVRGFYEKR